MHKLFKEVMVMIPARQFIQTMFEKRHLFHPSRSFLYLEEYYPWKRHLFQIEKDFDVYGQIKFVFYQDDRELYVFQAVPSKDSAFENRCQISQAFRGLKGFALNEAAGISDGEFVHKTGFIGGAWSLESCIKMAEISIKEQEALERSRGGSNLSFQSK